MIFEPVDPDDKTRDRPAVVECEVCDEDLTDWVSTEEHGITAIIYPERVQLHYATEHPWHHAADPPDDDPDSPISGAGS